MILHINTSVTWRGGEQQLFYLAQTLEELKIPQIVVGQPGSELQERCRKEKIPFEDIKMRNEMDLFSIPKFLKTIDEHSVRLIHAHTAKAHAIGLLIKTFRSYLNLIISRRVDFHINQNPFSKLKYYSDKNDVFLTVSNKIKDVLIEDGLDPEKIITAYSGIDLKKFEKLPNPSYLVKEFTIPKKSVVLGNVAALVDHKDHQTLLKAIALIKTEKSFVFLILGEGELEDKLRKLTSELDIQNKVTFTGFRKDVLAFYNIFDIFTLTSKEEGLGTSVLDAMASGLPIVTTNAGGITEMVEHKKGALVSEIGDSKQLAEYYTRLIEDENLRIEFGNYNKEHVKKFSVIETVKKTIQVYNLFLDKKIEYPTLD